MRLGSLVAACLIVASLATVARAEDPKAKDLLAEATATAQKSRPMKDDLLVDVVDWEARTGDIERAQATTELIGDLQLRGYAWKRIANALVDAGNFAGADGLIGKLKSPESIAAVHESVAIGQAKKGDLKAAQATLTLITDEYARSSVLEEIAKTQAKGGDVTSAETTLASIQTQFIRAVAYAQVATVIAKSEKPEVVMHWLEKAHDAAKQDSSPVYPMSDVAEAEVLAGDMDAANAIVKEFSDASDQAVITRAILRAYLEMGHMKEAQAMGAKLTAPADQLDFTLQMVRCLIKAGDREQAGTLLQDALALYERMPARRRSPLDCQPITEVICKLKGPVEGLKWAEGQTDPDHKVFALLGVVSTLREAQAAAPAK